MIGSEEIDMLEKIKGITLKEGYAGFIEKYEDFSIKK